MTNWSIQDSYEVGLCLDTLAFLTGLMTGLIAIAATFLVLQPYLYPLFMAMETCTARIPH